MQAHWLENNEEISASTLNAEGVLYQKLPTDTAGYQPTLTDLKQQHGYIEQDEIALNATMPNLDTVCAKFVDEHLHDDDEVRFVLEGEGVFDIRSRDDRWMRVTVEQGDLIVVPKQRYHRFELTDKKSIRCVRLYQDAAGWVPHYRS